jgi:hypothetical protein
MSKHPLDAHRRVIEDDASSRRGIMADQAPTSAQAEIYYRQRKLRREFAAANSYRNRPIESSSVAPQAAARHNWAPGWAVRRLRHS